MTVLRAATRLIAVLALVGVASIGAGSRAARAAPTHVAIAVDFGNGSVQVACAPSGGTGSTVLGARFQVQYNKTGLVAIIDGVGSMTPPTNLYWSYWHSTSGGAWSYASTGPATFHPVAGSVEGWAYNDGSAGPAASPSYASVCGGQDPAPTHRPNPPRVHHPSPTPPAQPAQPGQAIQASRGAQHTGAPAHAGTGSASRAGSGRAAGQHGTAAGSTRSARTATTVATTSSRPATLLPARPAAAQHESASALPTVSTAVALVAAASIGGTAFWRLRRRKQGW